MGNVPLRDYVIYVGTCPVIVYKTTLEQATETAKKLGGRLVGEAPKSR